MATSTGTELRIAMALRRLSGREVARRVGVSEFRISRILNDRQRPDALTLARIRAAIYDDADNAA